MKTQLKHSFLAALLISLAGLASSVAHAAELVVFPADLINDSIHIRTLAASCAACHGSNGNAAASSAVLAGIDANYFSTQMLVFKDGSRSATVMHHHAKGLNVDEINQLAVYFSQQKRITNISPKPHTLKADHEN